MPLLHWSILEPFHPANLAAIRFAAPVHISSLRIFPSGACPFSNCPDVVASTEPDAFFLQVFFNAQPINSLQQKDKQRAVNALIPSLIAYSGDQVDFTVDMGTEYTTRLMIIKGDFQKVSLAVYGHVVTDPSPTPLYESKPLPALEQTPLSKVMDPGNSLDPSELARKLLSLIPDSPSLSLVIRLMFCLKPSNEDWDHPDFPYLHAYIDRDDEAFDLESVVESLSRPLPEDTTIELLEAFTTKVADLIGPKDGDQAYHVAKLLSISASQSPKMARILLKRLDLHAIFDSNILDDATTDRLIDAAANVDIARHFNEPSFLDMLAEARDLPRIDKSSQYAINHLESRIQSWELFEDALSNPQGDFNESARMLKDIGSSEYSFGVWLESMIIHDVISKMLAGNPISSPQILPPLLFNEKMGSVRHDEFITFVRAFVGVASVLAVWAWSDSLGNETCREQSLAILHLWQNVSGYREIVNHLLLLRQLTRRLDWIISDNAIPRKSGTLAERVLVNLAQEPQAVLHDDLITTLLSLKSPLSFIAEAERLTLRKVALVAEDGLSAALEEVAFKSDHPLSLRRLRTLRVSLAVIMNSLDTEHQGEWHVVATFWSEQKQDLKIRLIEIVLGISQDLNGHFAITSTPAAMNQPLAEQLFRTFNDLSRMLIQLIRDFPPNIRALRTATAAIADVFACADTSSTVFSRSSLACIAAREARQMCFDFLRASSEPEVIVQPDKLGAEVVLGTLLSYATKSGGRDPVKHILQVSAIVDFILPLPSDRAIMTEEDEPSHWVTPVLPAVLNELKGFLRPLDVENRVHFLKRLVKLDEGIAGIGECLLTEELKHSLEVLGILSNPMHPTDLQVALQHELYLSFCVLHELVKPESSVAAWCLEAIESTDGLSRTLTQCLMVILERGYMCQPLSDTTKILVEKADGFVEGLKRVILLVYLRIVQLEGLYSPESMHTILRALKGQALISSSNPLSSDPLQLELSRLLSFLADTPSIIDEALAQGVVALFEWLAIQSQQSTEPETELRPVMYGLTSEMFSNLCDAVQSALLEASKTAQLEVLLNVREKIAVGEFPEELDRYPPFVELPEKLHMPLGNLGDLVKRRQDEVGADEERKDNAPSTPKGSKTPDLLGVVISPPSAILRSPAATGLTKTYLANDFRALRQVPSSRLNTSRLPSMHVDEFEVTASTTSVSPALLPAAMPETSMLNMMGGN